MDLFESVAALNRAASTISLRKAVVLGPTARQLCAELILRARRQQGPGAWVRV
jgi:hypothetical protein